MHVLFSVDEQNENICNMELQRWQRASCALKVEEKKDRHREREKRGHSNECK